MLFFRLFRRSFILSGLSGAALVAAGGAAFTAANTVPATVAGSGSQTVSGYTITNMVYNLNASNPQNIDSVSFSYATGSPPDPTKARVSHNNGTTWFNCDSAIVPASDAVAACATSGATVAAASTLIVVLTQ
ncbi:MAG: hypothetical protein FJ037_05385 [Chloroflexi bacterium]|nr:hypothetical protein [Chloroflexota bacterium]